MVDGKTAYARGSKITGSVHEMDRFIYVSYESMENARHLEEIRIKSTNTWGDQLVRVGAYVMNDIPYEQIHIAEIIRGFSRKIRNGDCCHPEEYPDKHGQHC